MKLRHAGSVCCVFVFWTAYSQCGILDTSFRCRKLDSKNERKTKLTFSVLDKNLISCAVTCHSNGMCWHFAYNRQNKHCEGYGDGEHDSLEDGEEEGRASRNTGRAGRNTGRPGRNTGRPGTNTSVRKYKVKSKGKCQPVNIAPDNNAARLRGKCTCKDECKRSRYRLKLNTGKTETQGSKADLVLTVTGTCGEVHRELRNGKDVDLTRGTKSDLRFEEKPVCNVLRVGLAFADCCHEDDWYLQNAILLITMIDYKGCPNALKLYVRSWIGARSGDKRTTGLTCVFGFHLFYLGKPAQGVLYLFTFGLCGIGFLVDLFRIPSLVKAANQCPCEPDPFKSTCTAYILGASPLGLLGLHHYYLDRPVWGILYTFTLGLLGVGWVYDWFRIPVLVKRANDIQAMEVDKEWKHLDDIYILWFPFGWLGFHHFYLNRPGWGVLYFFTFGVLGVGWLVDFCRLPCLVKDHNKYLSERRLIAKTIPPWSGGQVSVTSTGQTVVTVSNMAPGSVMTTPAGGVAAPPGGMMPPPYSYQNMSSYPPQGYAGAPVAGYTQGPGYPNQGFYPDLSAPNAAAAGQAAAPMPPSYEESLSTTAKVGPPPDVDNNCHEKK